VSFLDGIFDHGPRRWPAKGLYDLHLLTRQRCLEVEVLVEAIRVAFAAHSDPLENIHEVRFAPGWWQTEAARGRWERFRAAATVPVPEDLAQVAAEVAQSARPAVERLIALPM
jgi:hypothetical protein